MKGRVVLSEAAQRRLSGVWQVNSPSTAGRFLGPRAIAIGGLVLFALFLGGLLHDLDGSGSFHRLHIERSVLREAVRSASPARGGDEEMRSTILVATLVLNSSSFAQQGCEVLVQWGSPHTGGFENLPAGTLSQVALNYGLGVGLDTSGMVVCWGTPDIRDIAPKEGGFMKVAVGTNWGLGLREDGAVVAWGGNNFGQCNVPVGRFSDIAAGDWHSLALDEKGLPVTWGSPNFGLSQTPAVSLVKISTGNWHSLGIKSDGVALGWGWNDYGQTDVPTKTQFVNVAGGWKHSVGIRLDGSIVGWGADVYGCISEIPAGSNFVGIDSSGDRCIALRSDGSAVLWGIGAEDMPRTPGIAPERAYKGVVIGAYIAAGLTCVCPADFIADGTVNAADLGVMLNFWGTDGSGFPGVDLDNDGIVGAADLSALLSAWGPCPE
jgi:hypothetical protein